jgi:hypothetical protein
LVRVHLFWRCNLIVRCYRFHVAFQWQALHEYVPSHATPIASATRAYGTTRSATYPTPDIRRKRRTTTCLLLPLLPRTGVHIRISCVESCSQLAQPMMPGMAPPPPGAYVSSPFMQPMAYPPGMPPNGQREFLVA